MAKVWIPVGVPRHNATGRKCRAERVIVAEMHGAECANSIYDNTTEYRQGKTVIATNYNPDRWLECAGGIHFFLTREEAEAY